VVDAQLRETGIANSVAPFVGNERLGTPGFGGRTVVKLQTLDQLVPAAFVALTFQ
jgi:hypothetical protein